jgi:Fe-S-cluster containining protein
VRERIWRAASDAPSAVSGRSPSRSSTRSVYALGWPISPGVIPPVPRRFSTARKRRWPRCDRSSPAIRGILSPSEDAEEIFSTTFAHVACPVLDPADGRCELYDVRPISCRTYGPPVRIGDEDLPPCRLCFTRATTADIEAARVEIDLGDEEAALLRDLEAEGITGDTIVAFGLSIAGDDEGAADRKPE